jgi:hypothetical protein
MVVLSDRMIENYNKYADCLYFKFLKSLALDTKKNGSTYRIGVFYVKDYGLRIMLVGCLIVQGTS